MAVAYSRTLFGLISWYSFLIVAGILLAYLIGLHEEKRVGLPKETMTDAALVAVPCGVIGARLYFVAMEWEAFAANPLRIVYIWGGGVAIYGAVIGGGLGLYLYCKKKKLPFGKLADIIAPGLLLAQAIGRWGNYFNQEAFGPLLTDPALQFFPMGVQIMEGSGYAWHAATFFYESLWDFLGFVSLWLLRKSQKRDGNLFLWYLVIYGSGRFLIEQLRMDSLWLLGLRISQWLSLALVVFAAGSLLWRASRAQPKALFPAFLIFVAAIARWFIPTPGIYGALLLLITGLWAWCMVWGMGSRQEFSFASLWFLLPWAIDAACFIISWLNLMPYAREAQMLAVSVTLPCYCLWLAGWLGRANQRS